MADEVVIKVEDTKEAEPAPVLVAPVAEPVLEPLIEHIEHDEPKWIENATEHAELHNSINDLQTRDIDRVTRAEVQEMINDAAASIVVEPEVITPDVEIDIPPVVEAEPESAPMPTGRSSFWDVFGDKE